mmetsp:Transcript_72083/g.220672  ORF Transcript_72083/g.220672 Transcript_72083/m.220672 type:complete len:315 (-) Transcript_72083:787-1731(-)
MARRHPVHRAIWVRRSDIGVQRQGRGAIRVGLQVGGAAVGAASLPGHGALWFGRLAKLAPAGVRPGLLEVQFLGEVFLRGLRPPVHCVQLLAAGEPHQPPFFLGLPRLLGDGGRHVRPAANPALVGGAPAAPVGCAVRGRGHPRRLQLLAGVQRPPSARRAAPSHRAPRCTLRRRAAQLAWCGCSQRNHSPRGRPDQPVRGCARRRGGRGGPPPPHRDAPLRGVVPGRAGDDRGARLAFGHPLGLRWPRPRRLGRVALFGRAAVRGGHRRVDRSPHAGRGCLDGLVREGDVGPSERHIDPLHRGRPRGPEACVG